MRSLRGGLIALSFVALPLVLPSQAHAESIIRDSSVHSDRPHHLDFVGSFGFFGYTHLGLGGWYAFPVVPDGFIPNLNEALYVELGANIERYSWDWGYFGYNCSEQWWRVTPMGGVRWDWYLTDQWTVFAKGKLGYGIGFADSYNCNGYTGPISASGVNYSAVAGDGGVGAYWKFSEDWAMRFDIGYWWGVGAGVEL